MLWTPTVYVLGNLGIFQQLLTGLNLIFAPQSGHSAWFGGGNGWFDVGVLIQVAMLLGVLGLMAKGVLSQRHEWHHILLGLMIYTMLFIPTTNVVLDDLYTGQDVVVDHIPIGVAWPAGFMSMVGYYMSNELEQADSSVTSEAPPISITTGGFAAPLKDYLMTRAIPYTFVKKNENMAHTIIGFVQNCAFRSPGFSKDADVENATNVLESVLSHYNANGTTEEWTSSAPWGSAQGVPVSCETAATDIGALWTAFTSDTSPTTVDVDSGSSPQQTITVRPLGPIEAGLLDESNAPVPAPGSVESTVNAGLDTAMPDCSSGNAGGVVCAASNDGLAFMDNEIMGCMATDGIDAGLSNFGSSRMVGSLPYFCLMENAIGNQEAHHATTATAFEANVGGLESILEFLFFALTPLVAVMLAFYSVQGNYGLFGKYIQFGVWTQTFLPAVAIINNYSQYQVGNAMSALTASTGNGAADFIFSNMASNFQRVQIALSNANMMVALSPLITLAVITGSYYSLGQLAKSFSSEGASSVADTMSPKVAAPMLNTAVAGYGEMSTGTGTAMVTSAGLGTAGGLDFSAVQTSALTAAEARTASSAASLNSALANSQSTVIGYAQTNGQTNSDVQKNLQSYNQELTAAKNKTADLMNSLGISKASASDLTHSAATGAGVDLLGFKIGEEAKKSGKEITQQQADEAAKSIIGYSEGARQAYSRLLSSETSTADSSAEVAKLDQSQAAVKSASDNFSQSYQEQQSLQQSVSQARSEGFTGSITAENMARLWSQKMQQGALTMNGLAGLTNEIQSIDPDAARYGEEAAQRLGLHGTQRYAAAAAYAMRYASTNNPVGAGRIAGAISQTTFGVSGGGTSPSFVQGVTGDVNHAQETVGNAAAATAGSPGIPGTGNAAENAGFLGNGEGALVAARAQTMDPGASVGNLQEAFGGGSAGMVSATEHGEAFAGAPVEGNLGGPNQPGNGPGGTLGREDSPVLQTAFGADGGIYDNPGLAAGGMVAGNAISTLGGDYLAGKGIFGEKGAVNRYRAWRAGKQPVREVDQDAWNRAAQEPRETNAGDWGRATGAQTAPDPVQSVPSDGPGSPLAGNGLAGTPSDAAESPISPENVSPMEALDGEVKGLLSGDPAADAAAEAVGEGVADAAADAAE